MATGEGTLELIRAATEATRRVRGLAETREGWQWMGCVGAALQTEDGTRFTGVNLFLHCGIGFCAEHSAVAEMVKAGETRIRRIAAATAGGAVLPPCGRCRELLFQIDSANVETEVVLAEDRVVPLRQLLPENWQNYFDADL